MMIEKVKAFALTLGGIGILLLGLSAYLDRYEITATGENALAYRLDKRNGEVCSLRGAKLLGCHPAPLTSE